MSPNEQANSDRALLEVITVRLATHMTAIQEYIQRTLLFHTLDRQVLDTLVQRTVEDLVATGMIAVDNLGSYSATLLSQATVASSLTPEDGVFVHSELQRALRAFVMDGEMHIFYMFTPVQLSVPGDINWPIFRRELDRLDDSGIRVLEFVGVNPGLVNKMYSAGIMVLGPKPDCQQGQQRKATSRRKLGRDQNGSDLSPVLRSLPAPRPV